MTTGNREDYLINILRLTDSKGGVVRTSELAAFMDVAPASVTEMVRALSDAGLVDYQKYKGVSLTDAGREYAMNIRRKHHIVERFLTDVLDVDHDEAHEEACRIEHSMSDNTANKFCRIIGTRQDHDCATCGDPCNRDEDCPTLETVEPGTKARISHLRGDSAANVKKLLSMGFVPGREVSVVSRIGNGPCVLSIGESTIAIDSELASAVYLDCDAGTAQ